MFKYIKSSNVLDNADELLGLNHPDQQYDSANTSINSTRLPAIYKLVEFHPGDIILDYGGGKFDNAVNYLADKDVTLLVYDPYNRSAKHNRQVVKTLRQNGGANATVCSNVLNVIKEPEARLAVLENIQKLTKPGGDVYITVYEGSGRGNEGPTKSGYQLNRKTEGYLDEIRDVFPDAKRKGKLIYATNVTRINSTKSKCKQKPIKASSSSMIKTLNDQLYDKASQYLKNTLGWTLKDISDMLFIDISKIDGNQYRIEVRAELDYDWMFDLVKTLDYIVQRYDKGAYFDMVEPGISEAFINLDR